jgi:ABC-2 type transport system permease protein
MTAASAEASPVTDFDIKEPSGARSFWASMTAVIVKELRWRMRGRRAYVVVTIYVAVLGLLVFFVYQTAVETATRVFDPITGELVRGEAVSGGASAGIGQTIFGVILVLQTLLTLLLAPALTSGALSMEREKQTLELLITTPVSTLGLVVGKLVSSLAYVLILVLASIPLMSVVFLFGGIAPDDIVRVYLMLFAVSFGAGSIGLFLSAWLKRTQIATAIALVVVFLISFVVPLVHGYVYAASVAFDNGQAQRRPPPEQLVWLSAIAADIDLLCTAVPDSYGVTCAYTTVVVGRELDPQNPPRDVLWPRIVASFVILGIGLTLATTQMIAKSRRIRPPRVRAP